MRFQRITRAFQQLRTNRVTLLYVVLFSVLPTVGLILLVPVNLDKYIVDVKANILDRLYWFEDLDGNGAKEMFAVGVNPDSTQFLYVYKDNGLHHGQFNLDHHGLGNFIDLPFPSVDLNANGYKETIFFSRNQDSLFLNIFDYRNLEFILKNRFISTIGGYNNKQDISIYWIGKLDSDKDDLPEVYFSVNGRFALYPRRVFRYEYARDSLIASENTGAADIRGKIVMHGTDPVIIGLGSARGNITEDYTYPYHDSCNWLFGFNKDLEHAFPAVSFGKYPSTALLNNSGNSILVAYSSRGTAGEHNMIYSFSFRGKCTDTIDLGIEGDYHFEAFEYKNKKLEYLNNLSGDPVLVDPNDLPFRNSRMTNFLKFKRIILQEDINKDGSQELLLYDRINMHMLFYPDGQLSHCYPLDIQGKYCRYTSARYNVERGRGEIVIFNGNSSFFYQYAFNSKYTYRYLVWLGYFLASILFVSIVMIIQNRRIQIQQDLELQVADLQLQNLRNQLDPHFAFNALNSVGNAIYKENRDKAYDLFQRFTRMIRSSMLVSQQVFRTLDEELQFTADYLEFQKMRFRELFDYSIQVDEPIAAEKIMIPKMFIQSIAENAVKHAFFQIDYNGKIEIRVTEDNSRVKVVVEDNGVGIDRSKALKATSGTQMGEDLLLNQAKQINKLYKRSIDISIIDKNILDGAGSGTRVVLRFKKY